MSKQNKNALEPNYGSECIMYATSEGWAYGERTTTKDGVSYIDAEGDTLLEPGDWVRCADSSCGASEKMSICGPIQLAGMGDLIKALNKPGTTAVDNGDGTATITDSNGVSTTVLTQDQDTTYTFTETNPNDGDGIIVFTAAGSDGSSQDITIDEPVVDVDQVYTGYTLVEGVLTQTFEDTDGNPLPDRVTDLSALISNGLVAGDNVTLTTNAAGETVINATDLDTFTTQNADGDLVLADGTVVPAVEDTDLVNILTVNPDGSVTSQVYDNVAGANVGSPTVIPAPVDTDVSAVNAGWNDTTKSFDFGVTEGVNTVTASIPTTNESRKCGDLALVRDNDTKQLALKETRPIPRSKYVIETIEYLVVKGAAVDALVDNETAFVINASIPTFTSAKACWNRHKITSQLRAGNWMFIMGTYGDRWNVNFTQPGTSDLNTQFWFPVITTEHQDPTPNPVVQRFSQMQGTRVSFWNRAPNFSQGLKAVFSPIAYTPSADNQITANNFTIELMREEVLEED